VAENSPVDRYYKMYVEEPENNILKGLISPRERKFKHFKGCPNDNMESLTPRQKLPSLERQTQILNMISIQGSLSNIIKYTDNNSNALSVM
jgi:hypothetical protein